MFRDVDSFTTIHIIKLVKFLWSKRGNIVVVDLLLLKPTAHKLPFPFVPGFQVETKVKIN